MESDSLSVSLKEALEVFDKPGTPLTTSEVADHLDYGRRATYNRLEQLVDAHYLETKKVGASARVWWRPYVARDESGPHRTTSRRPSEELDQYVTIVESVSEPVYALDLEGRFIFVNEALTELIGYGENELIGVHASIGMGTEDVAEIESLIHELFVGKRDEPATVEFDVQTKSGECIPVENRLSLSRGDDGGVTGTVGVLFDISERKERESDLERALDLLNETERTADVGGWEIDPESGDVYWSDPLYDLLEMPYDEDPGIEDALDVYIGEDRSRVSGAIDRALDHGEPFDIEAKVRTPSGEVRWLHIKGRPTVEDGEIVLLRGAAQDVTQRKRRERELEARVRQQEAVADLGVTALGDGSLDRLMEQTVDRVARTLDTEYCKILELDKSAEELLLREGVGWRDGFVGTSTISTAASDSQAAYTLSSDEPVVVEDLADESRFTGPDLLVDHDVSSGISVLIGPRDNPWGILGIHSRDRREFDDHDVNFVQSVANILSTGINQRYYEATLQQQRREVQALNHLNRIVSGVTESVIKQSTREDIETIVCEELAGTESYEFAWIAGVDTESDRFTPRAAANTCGYHEEISIPLDPTDPGGNGPAATAARTRTTQVVQDVFSDPQFERWRDAAAKYDFRSVASIPLVHEDTLFGVLGVYANRENAFEPTERDAISRIGEVVGHAIASVERKRALLSEELVELTFLVRDLFVEQGLSGKHKGVVELSAIVPISDDQFLMYGEATKAARESMEKLAEEMSHWTSLDFHDPDGDTSFELKLSSHGMFSTLTTIGGTIEELVVEDGDLRFTVHLPPGADTGTIIDAVRERYPGVEMAARTQTRREKADIGTMTSAIDELTEQQETVLRAAFHAGFFNWPRDSSGEDLSTSLGISPPTLHYHLRRAQQQVVQAALAKD